MFWEHVLDSLALTIVTGTALAAFVQGMSGFGFALVALSIWSWTVPLELAAPMSVFGSLVGMLVTMPLLWRGVDLKRVLPMVAGGLAGVPIGVVLLGFMDPAMLRFGLGVLLVVYCPLMLLLSPELRLAWGGRKADIAAGWLGGLMGGIAGLSGPVPTLWTTLRGWDKDVQRGLLQGFNTSMHVATLTVYALSGKLIAEVWYPFALMVPAVLLPSLAGVLIFRRLSRRVFRRLVLIGLFASGLALLWGSVPELLGPGTG